MEHTVLVTGATAGFGEATARRFLAHGHKVIALGRRAERLEVLKASLPLEQQKKLLTLTVDVCNSAKVDNLATTLPTEFDPAWLDDSQIPDTVREKAREFQIEISLEQWQKLPPSQRFALIKLSRPGHENLNFYPALKEFHIVDA